MDKQTIIKQIKDFSDASTKIGVKLTFCALVPEMENYDETSYILQIASNWFDNKACSEIFDKLVPVLFENTTELVREKIYRMDIYDKQGDIHCRFSDLILENEIGYDPRTAQISY